MQAEPDIEVRVTDGRSAILGPEAEVRAAWDEMTSYTGGSSSQGRWSTLWGLLWGDQRQLDPDHADRLAEEAADFQMMCGAGLSAAVNQYTYRRRLARARRHGRVMFVQRRRRT